MRWPLMWRSTSDSLLSAFEEQRKAQARAVDKQMRELRERFDREVAAEHDRVDKMLRKFAVVRAGPSLDGRIYEVYYSFSERLVHDAEDVRMAAEMAGRHVEAEILRSKFLKDRLA